MSSLDILLMRHGYDDHSYIDGRNDTSLTKYGIATTHEESGVIVETLRQYPIPVDLHVSSKRRAIETAQILGEYMDRDGVDYTVTIDDQLRELYQGEMLGLDGMTHDEKVHMLELGWELFDRERIADNDDYKFGTPDPLDEKYAAFSGFIAKPYGESQNELSRRIERAFLGAIEASVARNSVPLFIVHRGTIREILNIAFAHNSGNIDTEQNPHIEMAGWRYCELFKTNLADVAFSLEALKRKVDDGR